jgi:hypothetical protein
LSISRSVDLHKHNLRMGMGGTRGVFVTKVLVVSFGIRP